ncbi:biotin--[acetyl-CoA-carboxylase] ligase [Xylanibacter brevis]|uniref:biotin--[acetyl-CoA-carboxylase] ligase n=1 Tax=Xylanibacter brevis TaxID=83231 RepID=UPI000485D7F9|nr:biotin--[acetyl-CoA-carboxylase] ligase [Xylanibacter brevis]
MEWKIIHIDETDSTNRWLCEHLQPAVDDQQCVAVWTDYQTAGRGCGTNTWESERGKNLLFSLLIHPQALPANKQFHISMAISLAICQVLDQQIGDVSIKWPNDIYWRNGKLAGILIENQLQGTGIHDSIIGVGLNVNQRQFLSKAPNPVSLFQIHGHETSRQQLLEDILQAFDRLLDQDLKAAYCARLYRRKGFHPYADANGPFMAEITDVEADGHLCLCDDNGQKRRYAFKEVSFII